jgi:DNA invertase Pin-like site-specific DNA recombinase
MTIIGYARVSTTDQSVEIQEVGLKAAGCEVIRSEKRSGLTTTGRAELETVLDFLRKGDVLMVTRIDRLARSIGDLQDIVRAVKAKGASLKATEQPIDTSTAAGKCFLDMLGVFAEFETNLRKERQLEGIAKAKAAGVYKGRPASIDASQIRQLKAEGMGPSKIAKTLGIGRASVYRALESH